MSSDYQSTKQEETEGTLKKIIVNEDIAPVTLNNQKYYIFYERLCTLIINYTEDDVSTLANTNKV